MKTTLLKLLVISFFLLYVKGYAGGRTVDFNNLAPKSNTGKKFKRTFTYKKNTVSKKTHKKTASDISITLNDFSDHLSLDKTRTALVLENSFTMDIGTIYAETNETWVLPNLLELNARSANLAHVTLESTGIADEFPDDATHAVYGEVAQVNEIMSLTEDDLFLYGFSEIEDGETVVYDYYATMSPVPLESDLWFEGTVTFIYEDEVGDTEEKSLKHYEEEELDSVQYKDIYYVIGQGTLKTFDDGDAEAIKLIYTEETREYLDGEEVYFATRDEIIIYSKQGHYIRAGIDDAWNSEGLVTLNDINYQKISGKTVGVNDESLAIAKTFPNPIGTGKTLTIQSSETLTNYIVAVYTIQGQKLTTLELLNSNKINQYEIKVPDTLADGIYFYKIHNKKGRVITTGKIQIL